MLPFHAEILTFLSEESGLIVSAKGLGLQRYVISELIRLYSNSSCRVIVLNSRSNDEAAWLEQLGLDSTGIEIMPSFSVSTLSPIDRQKLYSRGGVFCLTPDTLVTDFLTGKLSPNIVTGIILCSIESVTEKANIPFSLRLYREGNSDGFIHAFSESPERLVSGFNAIEKVLKLLYLTKIRLFPRWELKTAISLEKSTPDLVFLEQSLTPSMAKIEKAIYDILSLTLDALKRSCSNLIDLSELKLDDVLQSTFFDRLRFRFDSVWNEVKPNTRKLNTELRVVKQLLLFLLNYDAVSFLERLESVRVSNLHSQWIHYSPTTRLFQAAESRVFIKQIVEEGEEVGEGQEPAEKKQKLNVIGVFQSKSSSGKRVGKSHNSKKKLHKYEGKTYRKVPVLEAQPKWRLLIDVLEEIRSENSKSIAKSDPGPVIVFVHSPKTLIQICDVLGKGPKGYMERKWRKFAKIVDHPPAESTETTSKGFRGEAFGYNYGTGVASNRKKRGKFSEPINTNPRGSSSSSSSSNDSKQPSILSVLPNVRALSADAKAASATGGNEVNEVVKALEEVQKQVSDATSTIPTVISKSKEEVEEEEGGFTLIPEFDGIFGLVPATESVLVHTEAEAEAILVAYKPKFVVMYDPTPRLVRMLEVYKSCYPSLPLRLYHLCYSSSIEEKLYQLELSREKEGFKMLIEAKANMVVTADQDGRGLKAKKEAREAKRSSTSDSGGSKSFAKSSRQGGKKKGKQKSGQFDDDDDDDDDDDNVGHRGGGDIIVDMREFRSNTLARLHSVGLNVIPATLTVGDYIPTPEIAVERKSVNDLFSSLDSGRLLTQVTEMLKYYPTPVILVEFDEDKAFSLQSKYELSGAISASNIISKLVVLTRHVPQLRLVWSRSPLDTAKLMKRLKKGAPQPDLATALAAGDRRSIIQEIDTQAPLEVLKRLPGVTEHNFRHIISQVNSLAELSQLNQNEMCELIGEARGRELYSWFNDKYQPPKEIK